MPVSIGVPKETSDGELRVALVPEVATRLAKTGASIILGKGAGEAALIPDQAYSGATFGNPWKADIVLTVQPPDAKHLKKLNKGAVLLGFLAPFSEPKRFAALAKSDVTSFAVEMIPRISRAQSMDALSSQASVAGYKAVLTAAQTSGRFFPMLTTAAGTIRPSTVLVIGAGVAGLQALATARRLGAITQGYDVRPETKEQIESLGAKFLDLSVTAAGEGGYARELTDEERAAQQQALADHLGKVDIVITTAAVPGRPAPKILTKAMVEGMKPGSVIVDIAAETGGNCELTQAGKTIEHQQVSIVGPVNLPAQMPIHASEMYARNLMNFLTPWIKEGELNLDFEDEILAGSVITHGGEIRSEQVAKLLEGGK